jgi:hypothetical protein
MAAVRAPGTAVRARPAVVAAVLVRLVPVVPAGTAVAAGLVVTRLVRVAVLAGFVAVVGVLVALVPPVLAGLVGLHRLRACGDLRHVVAAAALRHRHHGAGTECGHGRQDHGDSSQLFPHGRRSSFALRS